MARRRRLINDQNTGATVDELRRQFNHLLLVLENIGTQVDAGTINGVEGWVALGLALSTGSDDDVTGINGGANNYTGTGLELLGLKVTPLPPPFPHRGVTDMSASDDDL